MSSAGLSCLTAFTWWGDLPACIDPRSPAAFVFSRYRAIALINIALALPSKHRSAGLAYGWKRGEESERIARLRQHLYFIGQCARDFPGHPTLNDLRLPVPEPEENSFGWAIDVANLIEELLEQPANLDFCDNLHDALYQVAFEREQSRRRRLSSG